MSIEGIDYSYARPGGAAIKAAGKGFVGRYLTPSPDGRTLTKGELDDLSSHGLDVAVFFEGATTRPLNGFGQGATDGTLARRQMDALGAPRDRPVYFACDANFSAAQQPTIDAYLRGCASTYGPEVGVYGGGYLLARCRANGTAKWFWQCASTSWGPFQQFNHVWQYQTDGMGAPHINGGAVDLDRAYRTDFGQWRGGAMNQYPVPKVPSQMMVAKGVTLYHTSDCNTTSGDKVIDPGRNMPYFGDPVAGVHAVEYVTSDGIHTGQTWFTKVAGAITPIPMGDPTAVSKATYDALKAQYDASVVIANQMKVERDAAVAARDAALVEENDLRTALSDWQAFKDAATKVGL